MKKICFVVDSIFSIGGVQRVTAVIAKELAKDYDVSIVIFDKPEQLDTALYQLNEVNINYRFFAYPQVGRLETYFCKAYSGLYLKLQPKAKWCSDIYAQSSYPSELRNALLAELRQGEYVLSSRWEGMPLVLVEAMAHGLPIISSDLPVSKEIMGDFGMYFKNGDIEDLAQRMEEATHIDWQAKSKEAIAIAQQFDIKNIITQWKQLIE